MTWNIADKTVLITGGNTGIGLETAVALARAGARVVITSRDSQRGNAALASIRARSGREDVTMLPLDLASFASIRAFADAFLSAHPALHVLINNAGLMLSERRETAEGLEATFGVNHLGPFLLTSLLRASLEANTPARVINVASQAHMGSRGLRFDDLQVRSRSYVGYRVYADSKLCNILFTHELARRLAGTGVTANALHPGVVATDFARDGDTKWLKWFYVLAKPLLRTPAAGARTTVYCATSPELADVSGAYFASCRRKTPSRFARDDQAAAELWRASENLIAEHSSEVP